MDEGTLALLDSLEERSSRGDRVTRNIDILLHDKENYNPWMEQMMEMLESENMTGFLDGSLSDPDPKGESQEERMRIYSEKWKNLDKYIMEWIRDTLDGTLKEVVQECKTSKDIWYMLRTYFDVDTDGISYRNVRRHVSIKLLNKDHYHEWVSQMEIFLQANGLLGYINGEEKHPDPRGELEDEDLGLRSEQWKMADKQVMKWIMDSLNDILNNMITEMKTAKELWDTLEMFFTTDYGALLVKPFDIKLIDKENYLPWRDQMMEFLYSRRMNGFIDGTLRDPDPKGESEVESVRTLSEKWKRLDKQVMEWIMASINDIFYYIVQGMETSKKMWDTLVTLFTGDIRDLLPSLEDSHSHGEVVMKISSIRLVDKENYQTWSDRMVRFLDSQRVKGFIDGTFRDPDPKGESGEKHVRMYSAICKRMDKQVKNWIMVSINDILYYMVEEMKTAKELWDTLEMFFTTEKTGPLDSNSLSELKSETSYIEWNEKTELFLLNEKMRGFIDGTFRDPSKISRSIRQRDKAIVKVYSERWTLLDQRVMTLIKSSLSVILHDIVKDLKSSKQFWHALEILFTTASFLSIKLSGKENYLQWAQQIKYLLEFHGLQNLIDPLSRLPPTTFVNHANWKNYNQLLKGWISSSLEQNVIDETLTRIPTATRLWGEIKNRYGPSDVEYTDLKGEYNHVNYTELYKAIMSGDLEATKRELDKHGYDVELTEDGPTPLHVIIVTREKNYQYFEKVLDHVVRLIQTEAHESTSTSTDPILVNLVNRDGRNTLHRAALVGNLNAAKRLVDTDPYLLFKEDNDKCLPIYVAISTPHKDTFRYLLIASKRNLNILRNKEITNSFGLINPFEGKHGVRLLNAAIEAGYTEVAYQLIMMNPDIAAEDDGSFRSPLHRAVENYDKYFSLPLSWRLFDEDAGMEFKAVEMASEAATETIETLPPNQGTQNVNIGDRWYSKPWKACKNLFKATVPLLPTTTAPVLAPTHAPDTTSAPVYAPDSTPAPSPTPTPASLAPTISSFAERILIRYLVMRDKFIPQHMKRRGTNKTLLVVRSICNRLRLQSTILEKRSHYHSAACVAACKDQHGALKEIAEHFPEVILMEGDGYNLMQLAVKYRSEKVFNFLAYETKVDTYSFKVKPKFGSSLLHYAGGLTPTEKLDKDSGAALQMRKEVKWFKKVEKFALPGCDNEKNNMDETPIMVFRKEHADLKKRGEEWMKTVANSYIIVAALIITITFAALITVPGGSQQDSGDSPVGSPAGSPVASPVVNQNSVGLPVFIENNLFMVFVFSNVTSFCGATSALVMFLSILTSRYTEEDFINKLPWKLAIGLLALIVSLVGMLVAFGVTLLLMLGHKDTFILVGIAFGIGLPVVTFIGFQVRMLWKIFR